MLREAMRSLDDARRGIDNLPKAVSEGMPYADVADALESLKARRARAEADVEKWQGRASLDVEDFADFLMRGADLPDDGILDASMPAATRAREGTDPRYHDPQPVRPHERLGRKFYGSHTVTLAQPLATY